MIHNDQPRSFAFFHSIRFRLLLWFTSILAVVLTLFSSFLYVGQARDLENDSVNRLDRQITRARETLEFNEEGEPHSTAERSLTLEDASWTALLDKNGNVISSKGQLPAVDLISLADPIRSLPTEGDGESEPSVPHPYSIDKATGTIIMMESLRKDGPSTGTLIMAAPLDPDGRMAGLRNRLILESLLTLLLASSGGYWLANRAMKPVSELTHTARSISESDLSVRVSSESRDEIGELADTFNQMLSRLQSAFDRQRQFVADASHELRTPLTIINLEARVGLSEKSTPKELREAMRNIRDENELMSRLVNDLLTLARMDAGQLKVENERVDLSEIAVDAIDRLRTLAEAKGARLAVGELPEALVTADRALLLQMTSDLVENAIKHGAGSENTITLETGMEPDTVFIRVIDTGPGINAEDLPYLFDRFYRVDKARSRNEEESIKPTGSGLGLSIVRWIAEANGGEIKVSSTPGQGSSFEARFPATKLDG